MCVGMARMWTENESGKDYKWSVGDSAGEAP